MSFAFIDVFFAAVLLFFAIGAAFKGLVRELFGKAAFILGTIAGVLLFRTVAARLAPLVSQPVLATILAFVLCFSLVFVAVKIVQHFVKRIFSGDILGSLDHALGFFFGLIEGIVVVWAVLWLLHTQPWIKVDALLNGSLFDKFL
jgi:membrane protein required for colicin V production